MLSRTGRLAAVVVVMAGLLFLGIPQSSVAANTAFGCGDPPPNDCCVPTKSCDSGQFCCFYDGSGGPKFCGCEL